MVALNQHFTILAVFCSLATISLSPLAANAVAIQGRAPSKHVNTGGADRHHSPTIPLPLNRMKKSAALKKGKRPSHEKSGKKQHKARIAGWSPITNAIRLADITLGRSKRHYLTDTVEVDLSLGDIPINKRDQAQTHFHYGEEKVHVRRHDHHDHHDHYDHDKIIVKGKDPHVHIHHRSAVTIPSRSGASYIVSRTPRTLHTEQTVKTRKEYISSKRDQEGVPGRIDITSPVPGSTTGKTIASLELDQSNSPYVLNASERNFTQIYLVNAPPSSNTEAAMPSGPDSDVPVFLQISLFDPSQPGMSSYCATINVNEGSSNPAPMTVEKCFDSQQGPATGTQTKKNQVFAYNGETGVIRPMWFKGQDDGKTDTVSNSSTQSTGAANVANVFDERDTSTGAQNVTLIFVPNAPEVVKAEDVASTEGVVTSTATMTTTVTITSFTTPTTTAVSAADVSSTSTSIATSSMSSQSSSPAATPLASAAALDVQVVGPSSGSSAPTTTASDSMTPTPTAAATMTLASGSTTPTTSINAEEVASSIAASADSSTDDASSTQGSSSEPEVTPVSTAPYQWMFRSEY